MSKNREGNIQKFPLLSLSFAIVGNGNRKIFSYAHLASIASEVKKQPVVDFLEGKVIGFEALVRGFSEENKLVSPYKLFEEAQKLGILFEFDKFCKEKAMKKFKEYGFERDFLLFLNIHSETIDSGLAGSD